MNGDIVGYQITIGVAVITYKERDQFPVAVPRQVSLDTTRNKHYYKTTKLNKKNIIKPVAESKSPNIER